jgi:hypothetical protein
MNKKERQQIFDDMVKGKKPSRFPMDAVGYIEYRKDVYHLGEPAKDIKAGEVLTSADGTKKYTKDGGAWDISSKQKYHDYNDVINVDLNRFIIEDVGEEMLSEMQTLFDEKAKTHVPIPWHYGTLMSRSEIEFGWEPLLMASALEPDAFSEVLDRIGESSLRVVDGWSRLEGVELIIAHDDIAATKELIWSPDFLRKYVFKWYKKFFDKIHENGKKVLYITDGNYARVIDDILELNPDGLYCESASIDPEFVMGKGGPELFYLLKTNARTMDTGGREDILEEVLKIKSLHERYPKIFSYLGGGTVKPENRNIFNEYYEKYLIYE